MREFLQPRGAICNNADYALRINVIKWRLGLRPSLARPRLSSPPGHLIKSPPTVKCERWRSFLASLALPLASRIFTIFGLELVPVFLESRNLEPCSRCLRFDEPSVVLPNCSLRVASELRGQCQTVFWIRR
jgi:hypothetical protein